MSRAPVSEAARGRWKGILQALGIDPKHLDGKNGPCPICRAGRDRFRFTDKNQEGVWICSGCGDAGDGLALLMKVHGWDFRRAAEAVEDLIGTVPAQLPTIGRSDEQKRQALRALWRAGRPVSAGDPVALHLLSRVGLTAVPPCLRYVPKARYQADPVQHFPAMIALVCEPSGRPVQIHRTFLNSNGEKAAVQKPRQMMPGSLPEGSSVRLFPEAETIGVGEGIETSFAAASIFGVPVWAAINAGNLAKWLPPQGTKEVLIFGDHDPLNAGQAAAWSLASRLAHRGFQAKVHIPDEVGFDWNDVLLDRKNARTGRAA